MIFYKIKEMLKGNSINNIKLAILELAEEIDNIQDQLKKLNENDD